MSGSGISGFSGISFTDHSGIDLTVQPSGEQELSGYHIFESGDSSGFPSGFSSGASGSGSASGHSFHLPGEVIYITDDGLIEVTSAPLERQPEQGRGVVEISGEGSGSGIHNEFSGILEQSSDKPVTEKLSIALPPGSTMSYSDHITSLGQSGHGEEEQGSPAGPTVFVMTPDPAYTVPTTAPSVSLATPAVVEQPGVEEGM